MIPARAVAVVLGVALTGAGVVAGQDRARRLEELRAEIEAREARARSLAEEAEGALGELEAIDRTLHELRRSMQALRQGQRQAEEDLVGARKRLAEAERGRARLEDLLGRRLVALYKFHSTGGVAAFYGAGTFQTILLRRSALARVLEQDRELFARVRANEARFQGARAEAERLVSEARQARSAVATRQEAAREGLVERKNLVSLLRTRARRERRVADELREAAARLEKLLREEADELQGPRDPLVAGQTPWPVEGRVRLGFGRQRDPEFGTETLRNGIEIEAGEGSPVRAVAAGRVLFAGWFKGYGQIVILDHGADVSVSGYLAQVGVESGALVERGEVIGRVGETGSLWGPGLYFEIRHDGKPVDPVRWFAPGEGSQ